MENTRKNFINKSKPSNLRDTLAEKYLPRHVSKVSSDMIMALCYGNFYPCLILRQAEIIDEGYVVYFFHSKEETEVAAHCIIGNFELLKDCEVSYFINGEVETGIVQATDNSSNTKEGKYPKHFLIYSDKKYVWVSLPNIFLSMQQSKVFY